MLDNFTGTEITIDSLYDFLKGINKYKYFHIYPDKDKEYLLPDLYRVNRVSDDQYKLTFYEFRNNEMVPDGTTKPMDKHDLKLAIIERYMFRYNMGLSAGRLIFSEE